MDMDDFQTRLEEIVPVVPLHLESSSRCQAIQDLSESLRKIAVSASKLDIDLSNIAHKALYNLKDKK